MRLWKKDIAGTRPGIACVVPAAHRESERSRDPASESGICRNPDHTDRPPTGTGRTAAHADPSVARSRSRLSGWPAQPLFHFLAALLAVAALTAGLAGCGSFGQEYINVFNWGEYIETSLLQDFEEETGIKVNYATAPTCEEMYAKILNGGVAFDLIVPSDYMVSRMIEEGMLEKLDFSNIPNFKYVDEDFVDPAYDPTGEYSVPYQWNTVGLIYNADMVDEADLGSWDILWNKKYKGQILMFDNSRDAMGIALKRMGYSYNTTDKKVLNQAAQMLIDQKPLVQAYVMDQIFDKMEGGEAAIAPYYSGDYYLMLSETDPDEIHLGYNLPEEGSNLFVDAMCIPVGTQNKAGAERFINFLLEPENNARNTEFISYSTPETAARELLPADMQDNEVMYVPKDQMDRFETYINLPVEIRELYDDLWVRIMSA